ncbi:MAG TPA: T9SS type A sorting domain-containing protein [Chitinophagaceae bacterium]
MNPNVPLRKYYFLLMPATILILLCMSTTSYAGEAIVSEAGFRDTILINKAISSKKHKVKLYPNADHRVLFFTASGEPGKVYQLFLFDIDGKLTKQIQIRNKETTVLTNIVKGSYLFEVFSDDERIENGQLQIK